MQLPRDSNGKEVRVGDKVRLLKLSGGWLEDLPAEEKCEVLSMIGEIFEIDEIDEHGHPWITREWQEHADRMRSHSIAVEPNEIERVDGQATRGP